jgi:hypothetical protein
MSKSRAAWLCGCLTAGLLAGCEAPAVTFTYDLPGAVPLPPGPVAVAPFTVAGGGEEAYAQHLAAAVRDAMSNAEEGAGVRIGGTIRIEASDETGTRTVRAWNASTKRTAPREVLTLVRSVEATVTFDVTDDDGKRVTAVEVRRAYRSTEDPRVRGELGLRRADDPAAVPPVETVTRELLTECAQALADMTRPVRIEQTVRLAPTFEGPAGRGIDAVRRKDYAAAAARFRESLAGEAAPGVRFNLAVALEAAGKLAAARREYEPVAGEETPLGAAAKQGALRVARVLAVRDTRAGGS